MPTHATSRNSIGFKAGMQPGDARSTSLNTFFIIRNHVKETASSGLSATLRCHLKWSSKLSSFHPCREALWSVNYGRHDKKCSFTLFLVASRACSSGTLRLARIAAALRTDGMSPESKDGSESDDCDMVRLYLRI